MDRNAMVGEAITDAELQALEDRVDAWRAAVPRGPFGRQKAMWTVLSIAEDELRFLVLKAKSGSLGWDQLYPLMDAKKYELKYALDHLRGLEPAHLQGRPGYNEQEWSYGYSVLGAHADYNHAVAAISGARSGAVRCFRQSDGKLWFRSTVSLARQANDSLESATRGVASRADILSELLWAEEADLPAAVRECIGATRSRRRLRPVVSDKLLDELDRLAAQRRPVLPPCWTSTLGDGVQIARSLRNLQLFGVAHVTTLSAAATGRTGCGLEWLLGEIERDRLVSVMSSRGGVNPEAADKLVSLFTYGHGVTNPDPALQFLFPLREHLYAVPWCMFASCNAERNFLALLARASPSVFDAASRAFEANMVEELRLALSGKTWMVRLNRVLPGQAQAGEVDAVILDPVDRLALVCELRWFLEPSEVREVAQREKDGARKAGQAETKMHALTMSIDAVCKEGGIGPGQTWRYESVAVFDNFLPTPSQGSATPLVSHRAFLAGIRKHDRLRNLVGWIRADRWLPHLGRDFSTEPVEAQVAGLPIIIDGVLPTKEGFKFVLERDAGFLSR